VNTGRNLLYNTTSSEVYYSDTLSISSITTSTIITTGYVSISTATVTVPYVLDVNGPMQAAVNYSNVASAGTITPAYFGTFYNMTGAGNYTVALSASQPLSNIGKYNVFRNNTGSAFNITITGGTGIISPLTVANAQSVTFMVATTTSYALF
jgi:hypothetical protein